MNLCRCPICGNKPVFKVEQDKAVVFCEECKKRGLTIQIERDNKFLNELSLIWNARPIHNSFIKDAEYLYDFLRLENETLSEQEKQQLGTKVTLDDKRFVFYTDIFGVDYSPCFGFYIKRNGNICWCNKSHYDTLLTILNIEKSDKFFTEDLEKLEEKSIISGLIKCIYYSKGLSISLNKNRITNQQVTTLYNEFIENKTTTYKDIINYSLHVLPQDEFFTYNEKDFYNVILSLK